MGYSGIQDSIENEKAHTESGEDLKDIIDEFDSSLACRRFPSIILGSSSVVELYQEIPSQPDRMDILLAESGKGYIPGSIGRSLVEPAKHCETWPLLDPPSDGTPSALNEQNSCGLPTLPTPTPTSTPTALEAEGKSDVVHAEADKKQASTYTGCKSQEFLTSSELIFDRPISFLPGISTRYRGQLEKSGFHTVGFHLNFCEKLSSIFF